MDVGGIHWVVLSLGIERFEVGRSGAGFETGSEPAGAALEGRVAIEAERAELGRSCGPC
jgi:hypothetical protein